mgnify:CR=1 FL=1|tara:strand:+ start:527 stop:706 length:180 start_codon:yes stop_codon:yes gene_type:complete
MKFSNRNPFVIKDKADEHIAMLRKEFERFLLERAEDSKGTAVDSEKYLRILRGKPPKND